MRVLGIDPGIGRTGIAIVDGHVGALSLIEAFTIETVPQTHVTTRLTSLLRQVEDVIDQYSPEIAAVETLLFSTNKSTAITVAQARGVILCAIGNRSLACAEYNPNQVKEAVAGFGGAKKPQVTAMTKRLLGETVLRGPDDTADACAIAICHHHRARIAAAIPTNTAVRQSAAPWLQAAVDKALARTERPR